MRHLAEQFRRCATQTRLPKYIELLTHTAEELEMQADMLSTGHDDTPEPPHRIDIHI